MDKQVLAQLSEITQEERRILRGEKVDLRLYNPSGAPRMDPGRLIPGGERFGIRMHTRFTDFPRHGHDYLEMIYQLQGHTDHVINGRTPLRLTEGRLLLLGRGTEHEIRRAEKEDLAVNLILVPGFFDSAFLSFEGTALAMFLRENIGTDRRSTDTLLFDLSGAVMCRNLLENLILGCRQGVKEQLQQLTLELLLRHLSTLSEGLVIETKADRERAAVMRVLSAIEQDPRSSLSGLAEELGMEVTALSRLIRRETGCTFTELLHTARFDRAVALLRETELSVSDVAAAIGYENTAFYYRRYAQTFGCTPAEYRRQRRPD